MPNNIVLLSDGTGNHGGVGHESNVWRLDRAIARQDGQICCYGDGVGSQDFKPLRAAAGAFGIGLSRNVRELYGFLIRHWEPGDRIYLFGFSRGAFTVRLLTGLIVHCGIPSLAAIDSERAFNRVVRRAYCAYRRHHIAPQFTENFRKHHGCQHPDDPDSGKVSVHFVGIWDTVDAIGVPFDELREAFDRVMHLSFRDRVLSRSVAHGCHALAIDDTRKTFHPVMWDERLEPDLDCEPDARRIQQVWFAGVHANVGGGYPKPQMALVSLAWMIERVRACDQRSIANPSERLVFDPVILESIARAADPHGRLYDSRAGLGAIYRYAPRDLEKLRQEYTPGVLHLHPTVLARIEQATDRYAPHNLPSCATSSPALASHLVDANGWREAMQACWTLTWMRQIIYYALLLSLMVLMLPAVTIWPLADLPPPSALPADHRIGLPGGLEDALKSNWTLWVPLLLIPLMLGARQVLKARQQEFASAGWASLNSDHRPHGQDLLKHISSSSILKIATRIRTARTVNLIAEITHGAIVRVLSAIAYPILRGGAYLHSAWCMPCPWHTSLAKPIRLAQGEARSLVFETNEFSFKTGIEFAAGERYAIEVEHASGWRDAHHEATPCGLCNQPPRLVKLAKPLLRDPRQPIFMLLARVGRSRPQPIGHGTEIKSRHRGMLELFVNDADLRIPMLHDLFYCNNHGIARIRVEHLPDETPGWSRETITGHTCAKDR